jgi:hypothetical protein
VPLLRRVARARTPLPRLLCSCRASPPPSCRVCMSLSSLLFSFLPHFLPRPSASSYIHSLANDSITSCDEVLFPPILLFELDACCSFPSTPHPLPFSRDRRSLHKGEGWLGVQLAPAYPSLVNVMLLMYARAPSGIVRLRNTYALMLQILMEGMKTL